MRTYSTYAVLYKKYIEGHFWSTYLDQLPQLQILLNICMISRAFFLKKLLSCKQTKCKWQNTGWKGRSKSQCFNRDGHFKLLHYFFYPIPAMSV